MESLYNETNELFYQLVHGPEIARIFTLPQVFLYREAHWYKQYWKSSQGYCRQTTHEFRLTDLFKTPSALSDASLPCGKIIKEETIR